MKKMTFNDYVAEIRPTINEWLEDNGLTCDKCNDLILDVYTKGSEVINIIRNRTEIDKTNLEEKIGDFIRLIVQLSMELGCVNFDAIALGSLQKEGKINIVRGQKVSLFEYQEKVKVLGEEYLLSFKSDGATEVLFGLVAKIGELLGNHGRDILMGVGLTESEIIIKIGEILRSLTLIASAYDLDLEKIIRSNIKKTKSRYNNDGIAKLPGMDKEDGDGR